MNSAASIWLGHVYNRISRKLRLQVREQEEIQLLKAEAEIMRDLRKKLVMEKYD